MWCVKNGFELIELNPVEENSGNEDDYENDFPESFGLKRLTEALKAHIWPNLVLKSKCTDFIYVDF